MQSKRGKLKKGQLDYSCPIHKSKQYLNFFPQCYAWFFWHSVILSVTFKPRNRCPEPCLKLSHCSRAMVLPTSLSFPRLRHLSPALGGVEHLMVHIWLFLFKDCLSLGCIQALGNLEKKPLSGFNIVYETWKACWCLCCDFLKPTSSLHFPTRLSPITLTIKIPICKTSSEIWLQGRLACSSHHNWTIQ